MKEIKYSQEILIEFDKLINDFGYFMSLNLMHADENLDPECQVKMKELINYSVDNNKILITFFEKPLLKNEEKNKEKLIKNFANILKFLQNYLVYAEPILSGCRPDIFQGRFFQINKHYSEFYDKYIA